MKSKIFLCLLLVLVMFAFVACGTDAGADGRVDGDGIINDNNANHNNGANSNNTPGTDPNYDNSVNNGARNNDFVNNGGNTYDDAVNGADGMGNGMLRNNTGSSIMDRIL